MNHTNDAKAIIINEVMTFQNTFLSTVSSVVPTAMQTAAVD